MQHITLTNKTRARGNPRKNHGTIPNVEDSLWNQSWNARNRTHTFAKNLIRNVEYYSTPARGNNPDNAVDFGKASEGGPRKDVEGLDPSMKFMIGNNTNLKATTNFACNKSTLFAGGHVEEDQEFSKYERENNIKEYNPLAGDQLTVSENEVRLLGKKERIVDYIRDSHLVNADARKDAATLDHANLTGHLIPTNDHQTKKGRQIYGQIKWQLRNYHETTIPSRWQSEKHDELLEKLQLEQASIGYKTKELQNTTKGLLDEKQALEETMPQRKSDRQLLGMSAMDKLKFRTEEDKIMSDWTKAYNTKKFACSESLTQVRRGLMEMTDVKRLTREAQIVRIEKLTEALKHTRNGRLIRLIIRELITLDCEDLLERVNQNMKVDISLTLKKDLIDFCRLEMQIFDLEVTVAKKRKEYLGVTGTVGGLNQMKKNMHLVANFPEKRAKSLTDLIDEPTRRAMDGQTNAPIAGSNLSGIPLAKRMLREEITKMSDEIDRLGQIADLWRERFAKTIIRVYQQRATRALLPDPNAMNEGLAALTILTSEDYARNAFVAHEKRSDKRDSREKILGCLTLNQNTLGEMRGLSRTGPIKER